MSDGISLGLRARVALEEEAIAEWISETPFPWSTTTAQ